MSIPPVPVPVQPLDAYLRRRALSAIPLGSGEAVTVAVALLRGCRDAARRVTGTRWWLRADGCPIQMEEDEGPDAIAATATALERLATMASDDGTRELVLRARESVLTQPPRDWEALERRFFQHAEPHPLVLGPLTPVERQTPPADPPVGAGRAGRVLALVDADLAEAVGEVLGDLRARWRSSRAVRLGAVAAALALVAVACLLAWPQSADQDAAALSAPNARALGMADPSASPRSRQTSSLIPTVPPPTSDAGRSDPAAVATAVDPIASARALFAVADGCEGEVACMAALTEDVDALGDPLLPGAAAADIELVDDFGGVVVVRLDTDATKQYVTLVRRKDRWLVRAVETVTDQPS